MKNKRILTAILSMVAAVVTAAFFCGAAVSAAELTEPVNGDCGNGVTWTLDVDGNFTVSGTGDMEFSTCPWNDYKDNIKSVTIEQGVTSIARGAFSSLPNLEKVTLADSVTSIGYAGFAGCSNLTDINLPDSITEIGEYAFTATALSNVTLPSSLRTVKAQLFSGCRSLEYVYIPDSVTVIEESVFSGSSVKTVRLPRYISYIPEGMFSNSDLESIELPLSIMEIREDAFSSCHLTKITLPEGVEVLGNNAFSQCDRLKSVILPNSLRYIGENSFRYTTNLENINIPGNVGEIQRNAFAYSGIKALSFNESSEGRTLNIYNYAFSSCTRLKTIELASNIRNIGSSSFDRCNSVDSVISNVDPDSFIFDFAEFIAQIHNSGPIVCYVPTAYLNEYKTRYAKLNITFKGDTEDVGIGEVLSGYSLSLEGDIGVKFYLRFNDVDSLSNDAKMLFTISSIDGQNSRTSEVYVKPQSDSSRAVATQKDGYYVFKCLVNAKEMTSIITAQVVDGEAKGTAYTYTVQDYAKYMLLRPDKYAKEQDLIKTMLNYGCACQVYFNYNLNNPANSIMSNSDQDYGFLNSSDIHANPRPDDMIIEGTDIKIAKASLVLNTTSVIKLFITGADENTVFKYGDEILTPVKSGEYYIVRIEGVSAQDIVMLFTLRVYDGNSLLGTLSYSPLYYFKAVLDSEIDSNGPITYNLKVLVSMMYKYGDAALKYHPLTGN